MIKAIKNIILKKRREKVSDVKLKDVILQSNKEQVIDRGLKYMINEECYELLGLLAHHSEDGLDPVYKDREHLNKLYDEIVLLCQKPYENELLEKVQVEIWEGRGFPWGFDDFIGMYYIDRNMEATDKFFRPEKPDALPVEFLLNCRLNKSMLEHDMTDIAASTLL